MRTASALALAWLTLLGCGQDGLVDSDRADRPDVRSESRPRSVSDTSAPPAHVAGSTPVPPLSIATRPPDAGTVVVAVDAGAGTDDAWDDPSAPFDAGVADVSAPDVTEGHPTLDWLEPTEVRWIPDPIVTSEASLAGYPRGNLGLAGNHVLWSDYGSSAGVASGNVHLTDLEDGTDRVLFTGLEFFPARTGIMVAGERFVSWSGNEGQSVIFLYDLGPDRRADTGDELLAENPFALVRLDGQDNVLFDWDFNTLELAFVDAERSSVEIRRLEVSPTAPRLLVAQQLRLCDGCVEDYGYPGGLAIHGGCVAFSDRERRMRLVCRNNEVWGDGDDSDVVMTRPEGPCSSEVTKSTYTRELRGIDLGESHGQRIAAWIGSSFDQNPPLVEVCLWGERAGPARRISEVSVYAEKTLTIAGDMLFFMDLAKGGSDSDMFEVKVYHIPPDLHSGTVASVPIMPGRIGRLFASAGRLAVARRRDGPDFVEVYELRDRPTTDRRYDQVAPDVDGDRIVWVDYRDHRCGEIYLRDRSDGRAHRLTHTPCPAFGSPLAVICPRISGNHVVWSRTLGYYRTPKSCTGDIFGIDLDSGPPYASESVLDITSELGDPGEDYQRIGRAQISDGRVVFEVRLMDWTPQVYVYEWGGPRPQLDSPVADGWGVQPDISGDRIVFVGGRAPDLWTREIRTCRIGESCDDPVSLTRTEEPCAGYYVEDEFYCYLIQRHRPVIEGDIVVWLDNRDSYAVGEGAPTEAVFQLYAYDFAAPVENGVQLSTTPWRSEWNREFDLIRGLGEFPAGHWDYVEPAIGYDPGLDAYVVLITTFESAWPDDFPSYPGHREVLRIDLDGPRALEERLLTPDFAWQGPPSADALGHIAWQDRSDGTFFQVYESTMSR